MNCPKCNAQMRQLQRENVTIDACDLCYGIWLDKGEIERVTACAENPDSALQKLAALVRSQPVPAEAPGLKCPGCGTAMEKVRYETPEKTVVDRCPACGGMWCDSGELVSIVETAGDSANATCCGGGDSCSCSKSLGPSFLFLLVILAIIIGLAWLIMRLF